MTNNRPRYWDHVEVIDEDGSATLQIDGYDQANVEKVYRCNDEPRIPPDEHWQRWIDLIAAAPALLEALESCVPDLEMRATTAEAFGTSYVQDRRDHLTRIIAVIRRAKGGE